MRIVLVLILINNVVLGQGVDIHNTIGSIFCDSSFVFNYDRIFMIENASDSFFDYSGDTPSCLDLKLCNNQAELLPFLKKEKELIFLTFYKDDDIPNDDEVIYIFRISKVPLKGNRKNIKHLIHQDYYKVVFRKNTELGFFEVSKVIYPQRVEALREPARTLTHD